MYRHIRWMDGRMAHIAFLGTGGDAYTVARQVRGAGGIIIELEGQQFHLDPGPGSLPMAKQMGIDLRKNVALLITHAHLNHAGDANAVLSAMSYGGMDPHGVLIASESVMSGAPGISKAISSFHMRCAERALSLVGVPRVGINTVNVNILPAVHNDPTAVGFQLVAGKDRISYTGDTGLTREVIEAHRGATVLIACMPLPAEEHSATLLNVEDVIELANEIGPRTLIVTHFGHQLLKQDVRAIGRDISKRVKAHVIMAEDGLTLDSKTYR